MSVKITLWFFAIQAILYIFVTSAAVLPQTNNSSEIVNRKPRSAINIGYKLLTYGKKSSLGEAAIAFGSFTALKLRKTMTDLYNKVLEKDDIKVNMTTTTTTVAPTIAKLIPQRYIPSFGSRKNLNRKSRGIAFPAMSAVGSAVGKFFGWTVVMTTAGVATAAADATIRNRIAQNNQARLARLRIDCDLNNSGCMDNLCWSNCGPRLYSADWCLTTKNATVNDKNQLIVATCVTDSDCNKCWSCATSCKSENGPMNFEIQSINEKN